jgi:hypothetical protein
MKVEKIPPPNIPKSHYKWAGIETEEEKKKEKDNDLDPKKIDKLVKKVYDKKYGTYKKTGEFVAYETETELQDWDTSENG